MSGYWSFREPEASKKPLVAATVLPEAMPAMTSTRKSNDSAKLCIRTSIIAPQKGTGTEESSILYDEAQASQECTPVDERCGGDTAILTKQDPGGTAISKFALDVSIQQVMQEVQKTWWAEHVGVDLSSQPSVLLQGRDPRPPLDPSGPTVSSQVIDDEDARVVRELLYPNAGTRKRRKERAGPLKPPPPERTRGAASATTGRAGRARIPARGVAPFRLSARLRSFFEGVVRGIRVGGGAGRDLARAATNYYHIRLAAVALWRWERRWERLKKK